MDPMDRLADFVIPVTVEDQGLGDWLQAAPAAFLDGQRLDQGARQVLGKSMGRTKVPNRKLRVYMDYGRKYGGQYSAQLGNAQPRRVHRIQTQP